MLTLLSEAMRLGAMIRPKAIGFFFLDGKSCAQGAALEAVGVAYDECRDTLGHTHQWDRFGHQIHARWPWVTRVKETCPACPLVDTIGNLIPHLNNERWGGHDWTREAIADWVAQYEPTDDVTDPTPEITVRVAVPVVNQECV